MQRCTGSLHISMAAEGLPRRRRACPRGKTEGTCDDQQHGFLSAPEHVYEVGGLLHYGPARPLRIPPCGFLDVVVGTAVPANDGGGLDLVLQQAQAQSESGCSACWKRCRQEQSSVRSDAAEQGSGRSRHRQAAVNTERLLQQCQAAASCYSCSSW